MQSLDIVPMFILGLVGTGHCIGMCGPLILAFPGATGRFAPNIAYHAGRILTYTLVGAVIGGVGAGLVGLSDAGDATVLEDVSRIQLILKGIAALGLLFFGLARFGLLPEPRWMAVATPDKVPGYQSIIHKSSAEGQLPATFALGLLMGLLPCGLSFAAFARALPAGGAAEGAAIVLAFGLGTFPGLLLLGTVASKLARKHIRVSNIISAVLMIFLALKMGYSILRNFL